MKDDLGKRMKEQYETRTRTWLPRRTYTIIRLDGKAFHTYTKKFTHPFDHDFATIMDKTALKLLKEVQGCRLAYVQSDEISLLLTDFNTIDTEAWFNGNVQKIVSVSASIATAEFNRLVMEYEIGKLPIENNFYEIAEILQMKSAHFDSRVFTIPDPIEVVNYFVWRQKDAMRNSISMLAQSLVSHKELHGKSQSDMHEIIFKSGFNWNDMSGRFKRGGFAYKGTQTNKVYYSNIDILKDRDSFNELIPKYE